MIRATCPACDSDVRHEVVDPLITVPDQVAVACSGCDILFRAEVSGE